MIVRLDGDVIVYRAGFAAEHTYWTLVHAGVEREFETRKEMIAYAEHLGLRPGQYVVETRREVEPVENALYNVRSIIRTAAEDLQADVKDDVIVYLSGPTNYRMGVATIKPYKGNRDPSHKPEHAAEIKAMIRREFSTITSDGEEADDRIGIDHYQTWLRDPYESVISTIDKDLDMIPGLHYNFVKKEAYDISPAQGIWNFYRQLLTGDTTDNIPGIEGIGPVRATKLLPAVGSPESALYGVAAKAYADAFGEGWEERMLEVGRLLWIRRNNDEWWNPPTLTVNAEEANAVHSTEGS